jgi:bacteriocin-like protein
MKELTRDELESVSGGDKLACGMWWLMWGTVAGAAIIGGGPIGYFGVALSLRGALSDYSPC